MPQPIVLTIAGFDPSSGAGVTADIKTLAAYGCYGVACITAMTVQSTAGVKQVQPLDPELVRDTLRELADDLPIAAIRVGMLGSADVAEVVTEFLAEDPAEFVVLDPVLKSSSGADLLDPRAVQHLVDGLLPLCSVVTPNVDEAAALTGMPVVDLASMTAAARALHRLGAPAVVVTGGHLDPAVDLLSEFDGDEVRQREYPGERLTSRSTHGTGCAFASALAANLALGRHVADAVAAAKEYVTRAIVTAQPIGRGVGPVNHFWRFENLGQK